MMTRSRITLLLACVVGPMIVAACGSSSPSSSSAGAPTSGRSTTTTSTTAQVIASPTVTIDGKTYNVPSEGGGIPIKPSADTGQQIIYTSSGFLPRTLYSSLQTPVVWTNLSSKPLVLTLEHVGLAPVTIATGATYSWTPNVLGFGYKSSTGDFGIVNVGAFGS
jgi:hypothetical protein